MDFAYTAYTEDKKLVRGKVSALSEEAATELLGYGVANVRAQGHELGVSEIGEA